MATSLTIIRPWEEGDILGEGECLYLVSWQFIHPMGAGYGGEHTLVLDSPISTPADLRQVEQVIRENMKNMPPAARVISFSRFG